jgi:hypothetical protein
VEEEEDLDERGMLHRVQLSFRKQIVYSADSISVHNTWATRQIRMEVSSRDREDPGGGGVEPEISEGYWR